MVFAANLSIFRESAKEKSGKELQEAEKNANSDYRRAP